MSKKILAFGAHPDDVEFGCAGLLIKEIEAGSQVKIVVCSLGEAGTNGTSEGRQKEAEMAAKIIGAEIEFISLGGDSHMENTPKNAFKLAKIIREYKPNIVLSTSYFENQHPDHYALSQMARSASRLARYGGLEELKKLPSHSIESLYFYPSSHGFEKKPDIIIDVSAQYDTWMKAVAVHESQMKTKNYVNMIESRAKAYGASIDVKYATVLWVNDAIRADTLSQLGSSARNY
ncbi:MAG: PIG-L family deacetylase [Candidatus Pacebacteria bacterium]|nr:PIG-L family deacetylase [Candidatus Paceibacterota bacterium]